MISHIISLVWILAAVLALIVIVVSAAVILKPLIERYFEKPETLEEDDTTSFYND